MGQNQSMGEKRGARDVFVKRTSLRDVFVKSPQCSTGVVYVYVGVVRRALLLVAMVDGGWWLMYIHFSVYKSLHYLNIYLS